MGFFFTIVTLVIALGLTWRYLGAYMADVFEGRMHFLAWAERPVYRVLGTSPEQEQTWKRYAGSMVIFSAIVDRGHLPDHPDPGLSSDEPAAPGCRVARAQLEHRRFIHDQHQLAELRRRRDDVVLLPDRSTDARAVPQPGDRHRRRHRHGPGVRTA